tara:strand:- start:17 stop:373 length:357 start_codon:yes stop_codon:yes gene_type:complete
MADQKTKIIVNPNAPEIYADKTTSVAIRGNVARISLASDRAGASAKEIDSVVSGHVALSVRGFLQLYAQMQSVVRQMEKNGLLKSPVAAKAASKPAKKKPAARGKTASSAASKKSKKT